MPTQITNTSITTDSVTAPTVNANTIDPTQGYLNIAQQNANGEGGEILLAGSNGNANAVIDNNNGAIRILQGANTRLRISTDGIVTTPVAPAFSAYLSADTGGSGTTKLSWTKALQSNSIITSRDSGFDETNDRFTAPVSGMYFMGVHTDFNGNISTNYYITIGINGSNRNYDLIEDFTAGTNGSIGAYRMIPMAAGDYAEIYKHGGTWSLYGGSGGPQWRTHWNGFLIG